MANLYEIKRDGQLIGTYTSNQLRQMALDGDLLKTDQIKAEGSNEGNWKEAGSVKSFEFKEDTPETISEEVNKSQFQGEPIPIEEEDSEFFTDRSVKAAGEIKDALLFQRHHLPEKLRELIHEDEEILWISRPSKSSLILSMLIVGLLYAPFTLGLSFLFVYLSWKNTYYVITKGRTIAMQGIFNVAVKIIFNENIQLISINTGIIDRWLGLNTIELSTAAQGGAGSIFAFFPGMAKGSIILKHVPSNDIIHNYASSAQKVI